MNLSSSNFDLNTSPLKQEGVDDGQFLDSSIKVDRHFHIPDLGQGKNLTTPPRAEDRFGFDSVAPFSSLSIHGTEGVIDLGYESPPPPPASGTTPTTTPSSPTKRRRRRYHRRNSQTRRTLLQSTEVIRLEHLRQQQRLLQDGDEEEEEEQKRVHK